MINPLKLSLIALLAGTLAGQAATDTWSGGSGINWNDASNWNTLPTDGDLLIFTGTANTANNNDFPASTGFGGIKFDINAGTFTLGGNSINFSGTVDSFSSNVVQTISLPMALTNSTTFNTVSNVDASVCDIAVLGNVSGAGPLTKIGGGTLTLASGSISGGTTVSGGLLVVSNNIGNITMSGGALKMNFRTYYVNPTIAFTTDAAVGIDLLDNTEPRGVDYAGTIGTVGYKWTKTGEGIFRLVGGGANVSSIDVAEGTLANLGGASMGLTRWGTTNVITVENVATLRADDGGICPNPIVLNGGDGTSSGSYTHQGAIVSGSRNSSSPTNNIFTNTITLAASSTVGSIWGQLIFSGNVNGGGGLTKTGAQPLILSGVNTYGGDTTISAGTLQLGSSTALPGGTTNGNVYVNGSSKLDLNGFNATLNALSDDSSALGTVDNSSASPSTLTIGGNNQSSSLTTQVKNTGGGALSLVKIGSSTAQLLGLNTYNGSNYVAAGTLILNVTTGATTNGPVTLLDQTTLSLIKTLSASSLKPTAVNLSGMSALNIDLGSFGNPSLAVLNATNGTGILTANGTNTITISCNPNVMSVGQFPLIKYLTRAGTGSFVLAALPSPLVGVIVTNTANKSIDLKITSAPITTWVGSTTNNNWDINTTTNWQVLGVPSKYNDGVGVLFSDTSATNYVNITTLVSPSATLVNSTTNYTFDGSGGIVANDLTKNGSGTLTILTTNNTYNNTVISGGILQVGNGGTNGSLSAGNIQDDATLAINHSDNITLANTIAGTGVVVKQNTNTLLISGANTYAGGTTISQGVVLLANNAALGTPGSGVALATITSGAALNVGNFMTSVTNVVVISGSGVSSNQGAIFSSGGMGCAIGCTKYGVQGLQLAADAAIGNDGGTWSIGNALNNAVPYYFYGAGFTLTKIGNNAIIIGTTAKSSLSQFVIGNGGVIFTANQPVGTGTIVITNNAWLDTFDNINNAGWTIPNNFIIGTGGGQLRNTRGAFFGVADVNVYSGSITLNDTLTILNNSLWSGGPGNFLTFGKMTFTGPISGAGGIINSGATNTVTLNGANTYTGPTIVTATANGTLQLSGIQQGGGTYTNNDGGVLDVPTQTGYSTVPMSTLALGSVNGATLSLVRLTSVSTNIAPITATNLVLTGTNSVLVPGIAFTTPGQYRLIKYTTLTGTITNLALGATGVRGVPGYLSNNVANSSIDLVVPGGNPVNWVGNVNSIWDIAGTSNFKYLGASTTYQQSGSLGDAVTFDDSVTVTNVNLATPLSPTLVIVTTTNNYTFTGSNLTGGSVLIKNGTGTLTLSNQNNTLTGGTFINAGTLKMATALNPAIALNNLNGTVTVAAGATLDMGSNNPTAMTINVSGNGVGGNGAIQANYSGNAATYGVSVVNQTGNLTIGGNNRWDVRNNSKQWNVNTNGATLTKVGSGYTGLNGVTVSTNLGDVIILGGTLSYQAATTGLGNTNNTIYVGNGAALGFNNSSIPLTKSIVLSNNAAISSDGGNAANLNVIFSPVKLDSGTANLNFNFYNGAIFSNTISGAGGIALQFQSIITFAASNTYSGNTTIPRCNGSSGGLGTRLILIGNGSIANSPLITLQGTNTGQLFAAFLDVTGRSDGTLTLATNQTLRGDNGSFVRGKVVAAAGSTISVGGVSSNYQYMTFSNTLTFAAGSTNIMDVYKSGSFRTNDLIIVSNLVTYAGTLQMRTNGLSLLAVNDTFKLFTVGSVSGNFTAVTDPSGTTWSFNPATGVATVTGLPPTVNTTPTNIIATVSGSILTLAWPADHLGWHLQLQTNSLSVGLLTNAASWVTLPGSDLVISTNMTINPANGSVFYRMVYP